MVLSSNATVANATLACSQETRLGLFTARPFFCGEGVPELPARQDSVDPPTGQFAAAEKFGQKRLAAFAKKDSEKSNNKRGA